MSSATHLSTHDQVVLSKLLNPGELEEPTQAQQKRIQVNTYLPPDQHVSVELVEKFVQIEKTVIESVDKDDSVANVKRAIEKLKEIIVEAPKYASVYNNLAQLERILDQKGEKSASKLDVISNLERAIKLAGPDQLIISKMQGTVLQQAYAQLGQIYMEGRNNEGDSWGDEEKASECFRRAGEYGNKIAAELAVKVNPYARLCGNIVREALIEEGKKWEQLKEE
ncbi:YALIH222S03e30042g1_1 [Yarrowia lipolytica]|nr:YALIH222S03e30042g1_1 [Yarrowia lipolytica]